MSSTSSDKIVVVKIIGGLGNQLFQYAHGRSLSLRTGAELLLDLSGFEAYDLHSYSLEHFNIVGRKANEEEIIRFASLKPRTGRRWFLHNIFFANRSRYALEQHYHFDTSMLLRIPPVYLDGYWQSEQYFAEHETQLRKDLQPRHSFIDRDAELIRSMSETHSVSLHVRRGDFVHHSKISAFHGTCTPEYYNEAVEIIAKKVNGPLRLYVFSDDPKWVRENLRFPHHTEYVDHNDASRNYVDMMLMSSCKHHIIANSSFSWWGAWLDPRKDKTVIAPRTWVRDPNINTKDLLPQSWIRV